MPNPYVLNPLPDHCLGRADALAKVADAFASDDPRNVSVFGPKYIGKTVLLKEVERRYRPAGPGERAEGSPFDGVVYWPLRHADIADQDALFASYAEALREVVRPFNADAYDLLRESGTLKALQIVAGDMDQKAQRVLVVMDDFEALMRSDIGMNAWDGLRNLAYHHKSVRYLVGSRRPLTELCSVNKPGFELSDFPRLFPTNLPLGPFSTDDLEAFGTPLLDRGVTFAKGAVTEVQNWTGGVPSLCVLLYHHLWESVENGSVVDNKGIQTAVAELRAGVELPHTLAELWTALGRSVPRGQQALAALASDTGKGVLTIGADITKSTSRELVQHGYVEENQNRVKPSCLLMMEHAREHGSAASAVHQLFGTSEAYEANMPGVLGLRSGHTDWDTVESVQRGLRRKAEHVVEHADEVDLMAAQVRLFVNAALDGVLRVMLPDGQIPIHWTARWKMRKVGAALDGRLEGPVPSDGPERLRLLREATFSSHGLKDVPLSRGSYVLLSFLWDVANEGQHLTSDLGPTFSHAVCLAVTSLCNQLATELEVAQPGA